MARAHPATVRRIFAEGHTIGTHSEDHPVRFGKLPPPLVEWKIDTGIRDVGAALDDLKQVAPFFRVPGLARSDVIESELAARVLVDFGSDTVADDWHIWCQLGSISSSRSTQRPREAVVVLLASL